MAKITAIRAAKKIAPIQFIAGPTVSLADLFQNCSPPFHMTQFGARRREFLTFVKWRGSLGLPSSITNIAFLIVAAILAFVDLAKISACLTKRVIETQFYVASFAPISEMSKTLR
jgi:hypothetical protein